MNIIQTIVDYLAHKSSPVILNCVIQMYLCMNCQNLFIGDSIGVDVCSIAYNGQHLKYSVSLLGYGYYGDVIVESERLRWMGPKRYDWCGKILCCGILCIKDPRVCRL